MADKPKHNPNLPPPRAGIGLLGRFIEQLRLSWLLLLDNRVSIWLKIIPFLGVAYAFTPFSFIMLGIPIIGLIEDVAIFLIALVIFNQLAPEDVVADHLRKLRYQAVPHADDDPDVIEIKATKHKVDENIDPAEAEDFDETEDINNPPRYHKLSLDDALPLDDDDPNVIENKAKPKNKKMDDSR